MPQVRIATPEELSDCLAIRHDVFVLEQAVTVEEDLDGLDAQCVQFLAITDEGPVGTARMRKTDDGEVRAERVAVRASSRGLGLGALLMDALEDEARRRGEAAVVLHAQVEVVPFYARRGYEPFGSQFLDARIPHQAMRKPLRSEPTEP